MHIFKNVVLYVDVVITPIKPVTMPKIEVMYNNVKTVPISLVIESTIFGNKNFKSVNEFEMDDDEKQTNSNIVLNISNVTLQKEITRFSAICVLEQQKYLNMSKDLPLVFDINLHHGLGGNMEEITFMFI